MYSMTESNYLVFLK